MNKAILTSLLLLLSFLPSSAKEKLLIITHVYCRPDFIDLHIKTINAFLENPYEYIVFNDAPNEHMKEQIEETCKRNGISCYRVPQELHTPDRSSPGHRHMNGIKFSLEKVGFEHNGVVMILDSDMFFAKPFSVEKYMQNYDFIGGYQSRESGNTKIEYTSPCLVLLNMKNLPNKRTLNFDGNQVEGVTVDVGGHSYYYFKNNPQVPVRFYTAVSKDFLPLDAVALKSLGYDDPTIAFILNVDRRYGFEFHGDTHFIHYYAGGSNWPGYSQDWINQKNKLIFDYLEKQIAYYLEQKK